ncbi:MAG: hypothetical protein KKD77_22470 [Gammaproteobacteria bacterium]|nr:hypothetical protein [Gammaproteobacteria bacterium]
MADSCGTGWGVDQYLPVNILIRKPCKGYYLRWYYNGWHYWFFLPGETNMITEGEEYRTIGTRKITMSSGQVIYTQIQAIRTILLTREVYLLTADGWKNIRVDTGSIITYKNFINGYEVEITTTIGSKEISLDTGFSPVGIVPIVDPTPDPGLCECIIGTQIWACKNYDSNYPGSKIYADNYDNLEIYGRLYTYLQIMSSGFCPPGWHVPTLTEWNTLITFLGGAAIAGSKLKEAGTDHWNTDTTIAPVSCFEALGGGYGNFFSPHLPILYSGLKEIGNFWTVSQIDTYNASYIQMIHNANTAQSLSMSKYDFLSVRLIKDTLAGDFDDWFLPSKDALNAMYTNLYLHGVGDLINDVYWSSSEDNAFRAFSQHFGTGASNNPLKTNTWNIRAARSFIAGVGAFSLRDTGPAGGLIFYIDGAGTTYFEAAPYDQSASQIWSNIINVAVTGTGTAIGTGDANTDLIIAQPGHTDSAAKLCKDLII